jgi:hypothetical protein
MVMHAEHGDRLAYGDARSFREFRLRLADCRRRGLSFEEAWEYALPKAWPGADSEVLGTRGILEAQREVWRACYERRPVRREERGMAGLAAEFYAHVDEGDADRLLG